MIGQGSRPGHAGGRSLDAIIPAPCPGCREQLGPVPGPVPVLVPVPDWRTKSPRSGQADRRETEAPNPLAVCMTADTGCTGPVACTRTAPAGTSAVARAAPRQGRTVTKGKWDIDPLSIKEAAVRVIAPCTDATNVPTEVRMTLQQQIFAGEAT